jgi:hypothetical protein
MNQPTDFIRLSAWRVFKERSIGQRYTTYQSSISLISYKGYSTYRYNFGTLPFVPLSSQIENKFFATT